MEAADESATGSVSSFRGRPSGSGRRGRLEAKGTILGLPLRVEEGARPRTGSVIFVF